MDVLVTIGKVEKQFGYRSPRGTVGLEQHGAQFPPEFGPAWLKCKQIRNSLLLESLRNPLQLEALAGTLDTFKGNEFASVSHSGSDFPLMVAQREGVGGRVLGHGREPCMSLVRLYLGVVNQIQENLQRVQAEVVEACRTCGRDSSEVRLVAVSKTFPPEAVTEAANAGQLDFGENRVQEARDKVPGVARPGLRWHLIGHLQSNKVRLAVELFDMIQTVDSARIARRLDRVCEEFGKVMPVLVEVNIAEEPQKAGVAPSDVGELLSLLGGLKNLDPVGLMAIPPFFDDPEVSRPHFRRLAVLSSQLKEQAPGLRELSMGMSSDFRVAIEEGATIVRVGTAIFGHRP